MAVGTVSNKGFTLLEVIIAVAIVATMAGALAPAIYREVNVSRAGSTTRELDSLGDAMLDFYADVGRFPTEAEGLGALVADPGVGNWRGPYLDGGNQDPLVDLATDAFGRAYEYDYAPSISGGTAADLIVTSGGIDGSVDMGSINGTWNLAADCDDLFVTASAAALERRNEDEACHELEVIAEACREYFRDFAVFPGNVAALAGGYLDRGYDDRALLDSWNNSYLLASSGGTPPVLTVFSCGPDGVNNSGGGDDQSLIVSSVPPGRHTSLAELEIAQTLLNANSTLVLAGTWTGSIRPALGLATAFNLDGWGNSYAVNAASRVIYSCGPDGVAATTSDNLPTGVGP